MQPTVHVVATTLDATRAALATAVPLARGAGATLTVLVPQVLPYAVELEAPVQSAEFVVRKYRDLIEELGGDAAIRLCLCRRPSDVSQLLPEHATVVVGGAPAKWVHSSAERLVRYMSRLGHRVIFVACWICCAILGATVPVRAQQPATPSPWQYGAFVDVADLTSDNKPSNHLFRNRGTTPRVDEVDLNMAAAFLKKPASESSRAGLELTVHTGKDSELFGFSATAPNIGGAETLLHFGPTNLSYLTPAGKGLTIQGGIFSSLIGYDSLYAKDNFNYTRPWGADYTPYLMIGVNASYPVTARLTATGAVVSGYWHLAHANDAPSVVGQLAFKASEAVTFKQTLLAGSHQPETSLSYWRLLADSILERKSGRLVTALEYQFGTERVATAADARAQWMSAQAVAHVQIQGPWSVTARPEFAWDRDGRWIGGPQSVKAFTGTLEYRVALHGAQAILRAEYRVDDSRGSRGGFFTDASAPHNLTPTQNLFVVAAIFTFDGTIPR